MPDGPRPNGPGYDDDFYAWTQYQAAVLREMPAPDNRFDREHVAEEIEDLGKSERDAVRSQVTRILEHFLKLSYSPATVPRHGWSTSIANARDVLADSLTPTLRRDAEAMFDTLYIRARRRAELGLRDFGEGEAADRIPGQCPYTFADVLRDDWYPDPVGEQP